MEVQVISSGRELTLTFYGELDHHGARDTMLKTERAIEAAMPRKLTMDFSGVSFMDSSGIAVVMRAYRRMNGIGGKMELCRVPAQAKKVFDAAGIPVRANEKEGG